MLSSMYVRHCDSFSVAQASHDTGGYTTGGGYTTAGGMTSGTEAFASDMEGMAIKKEKKKKKTKNKELLQHREKAQPEKIKSECDWFEVLGTSNQI